jgi:hypothetical protein
MQRPLVLGSKVSSDLRFDRNLVASQGPAKRTVFQRSSPTLLAAYVLSSFR